MVVMVVYLVVLALVGTWGGVREGEYKPYLLLAT